jgi:hypothetical protein
MKVREVKSKHRASINTKEENHGAVTPGPTETNKPTKNKQNSVNNDDTDDYSPKEPLLPILLHWQNARQLAYPFDQNTFKMIKKQTYFRRK